MTGGEHLVYKILTGEQWQAFQQDGEFAGAPVDLADGFIHLSAGHQVAETARRHFGDQTEIWLIAVDARALGESLKWEISRGGEPFPHFYGELTLESVVSHRRVTRQQDADQFEIGG